MLPWTPRRCGAGKEQVPEEQGPSAGSDPGQAWDSGEEALREPRTTPQDSPQAWSRRPSWTRKEQLLPRPPPGLAAERSPGTPVPLSPQMTWEVAPSRMSLLAPWDPNCEAKPGPRLVWGLSRESGTSSGQTLRHPSFCLLYEAASGRGLRPSLEGRQSGEQAPREAGFPVMCCEDVFLSDPLLPCGQRVPLYLSQARQQVSALPALASPQPSRRVGRGHLPLLSPQVMGSLKLPLPPPGVSPRVLPTPPSGCSIAWLSGPELIALTGLLQMSQGEPRPSSPGAPLPPAGPPDPASDHPGASGGQSCSHCTDPSLPRAPDSQGP
ncbi:histone deacetylase complex subunit SAP25 isoform X1 [Physeter macrocephalus]|uniref:Histone deacetylase complex subunit SAP25 isoform X1 n=1 Tax=Physeter macrocephalus TaxID=9755 RepID=A0A455B5T8_PHYMC|nr:histone deacetylase complex subunit SAP25 isoform X1 [Physeter catodon]|eukprot:XP_028339371.1 histone deacetylase complex subunit SAP25 isoform X1 [Physeter catodon]